MITRDGLVAEYLFNSNADDSSGSGFHGLVSGATPGPDRFGTPNSAFMFDGKDDYIIVSPPPRLTNVALTVSVWARCDASKQRGWHASTITRLLLRSSLGVAASLQAVSKMGSPLVTMIVCS